MCTCVRDLTPKPSVSYIGKENYSSDAVYGPHISSTLYSATDNINMWPTLLYPSQALIPFSHSAVDLKSVNFSHLLPYGTLVADTVATILCLGVW